MAHGPYQQIVDAFLGIVKSFVASYRRQAMSILEIFVVERSNPLSNPSEDNYLGLFSPKSVPVLSEAHPPWKFMLDFCGMHLGRCTTYVNWLADNALFIGKFLGKRLYPY